MSYACPKCGSENTQKITAVAASGTTEGTSQTTTVGGGVGGGGFGAGVASGTTKSQFQTELAKRFSPPEKEMEGVFFHIITGLIIYAVVMAVAAFFIIGFGEQIIGEFLATVAWLAFGVWYGLRRIRKGSENRAKSQRFNREEYPALLDMWENGFYCHRCEHTYTP